jgi:ABC-type multidrug transport system ATPase subunit
MYKYNGETRSSTSHHLCAYVSQNDLHHPEMTVRETINFASNMLGANNEFGTSTACGFWSKQQIK